MLLQMENHTPGPVTYVKHAGLGITDALLQVFAPFGVRSEVIFDRHVGADQPVVPLDDRDGVLAVHVVAHGTALGILLFGQRWHGILPGKQAWRS